MKKEPIKIRREKAKRKLVVTGYVGEWSDGTLGWFLPNTLSFFSNKEAPRRDENTQGQPSYLCKITVERIPGARRRFK